MITQDGKIKLNQIVKASQGQSQEKNPTNWEIYCFPASCSNEVQSTLALKMSISYGFLSCGGVPWGVRHVLIQSFLYSLAFRTTLYNRTSLQSNNDITQYILSLFPLGSKITQRTVSLPQSPQWWCSLRNQAKEQTEFVQLLIKMFCKAFSTSYALYRYHSLHIPSQVFLNMPEV